MLIDFAEILPDSLKPILCGILCVRVGSVKIHFQDLNIEFVRAGSEHFPNHSVLDNDDDFTHTTQKADFANSKR